MSYIRTVTKGGHKYRQLVESYWDKKAKRPRTRILKHLGPVSPVYGRASSPLTLPMEVPHVGLLATRIMMGSLTAAHVIQTVQEMGEKIPPGDLTAVGIRYDLGGKKPRLELLLWLVPPSPPLPPAPSVVPPSRSRARSVPPSSPSRAKRT